MNRDEMLAVMELSTFVRVQREQIAALTALVNDLTNVVIDLARCNKIHTDAAYTLERTRQAVEVLLNEHRH